MNCKNTDFGMPEFPKLMEIDKTMNLNPFNFAILDIEKKVYFRTQSRNFHNYIKRVQSYKLGQATGIPYALGKILRNASNDDSLRVFITRHGSVFTNLSKSFPNAGWIEVHNTSSLTFTEKPTNQDVCLITHKPSGYSCHTSALRGDEGTREAYRILRASLMLVGQPTRLGQNPELRTAAKDKINAIVSHMTESPNDFVIKKVDPSLMPPELSIKAFIVTTNKKLQKQWLLDLLKN